MRLGDGGNKTAWTFSLGYGLGFPLRPRMQVQFLQEVGLVIGKRIPGRSSNTAQTSTTRLGLRLGLGG
jgi:hypothetical protein